VELTMADNLESGNRIKPMKPTSGDVIYNNMTAAARLARKSRAILESQLKVIEAELKHPATITARRMECLRAVLEITAMLDRTVESGGRLLTAKPTPGSGEIPPSLPTAAEVMDELTLGRKSGRAGHGR
jgi:hypothetical protein